jgi:predicted ATP-grasp superfamily ATP-dependent carboligase
MLKRAIIVFSGYNQRAVISFCRVARAQNTSLIIIAKSESDPILDTEYKEYVKCIRANTDLNLHYIKGILREIKRKEIFEEYIILPSSEALNRFLLENRKELEEQNFVIPLVNKNIYNLISDKYDFGHLCIENDIRIPNEKSFEEDITLPIVIKPKKYFANDGQVHSPYIIKEKGELSKFFANNKTQDFYIQEYIGGESYYLLYYFCKDGTYEAFSQKNILQQSQGKSIIAAISSDIHENEISNKFVNLFKSIKFTGLVMIEIKYYNGEYFMIEANPRLWGPSQLFIDSHCVFFELFLKDWGFNIHIQKPLVLLSNIKYFWLGGLVESINKYGEIVFHTDNYNFFEREFIHFLLNDIYLKEDTKNIFMREILGMKGGENTWE